ncbi:MAG: hypothetical protein V3V78_03610 [Candidatus Woesearchaeota archaeon]
MKKAIILMALLLMIPSVAAWNMCFKDCLGTGNFYIHDEIMKCIGDPDCTAYARSDALIDARVDECDLCKSGQMGASMQAFCDVGGKWCNELPACDLTETCTGGDITLSTSTGATTITVPTPGDPEYEDFADMDEWNVEYKFPLLDPENPIYEEGGEGEGEGEGPIPEFSTTGLIMTLAVVAMALMLFHKRKKK